MRRIFVFLSVILILAVSVVPAFAASSTADLPYYSILSFETVSGSLGSEVGYSWPFNVAQLDTTGSEFSLGDGLFWGDVSTTNVSVENSLSASFYFPEVAGSTGSIECLTLSKKLPQVVSRGKLGVGSCEILANVSDLVISSVRLSGSVANIEESTDAVSGDEVYKVTYYGFDRTFSCDDNVARIGEWLNECLNSISAINGQYYVLLEGFTVELEVYRSSVSTPQFFFMTDLTPNLVDVNQWFFQYDLECTSSIVVNEGDFDVVAWLQTSVGGFLDFQFIPGFSINKIFWVILVVGVALWFFKVIR